LLASRAFTVNSNAVPNVTALGAVTKKCVAWFTEDSDVVTSAQSDDTPASSSIQFKTVGMSLAFIGVLPSICCGTPSGISILLSRRREYTVDFYGFGLPLQSFQKQRTGRPGQCPCLNQKSHDMLDFEPISRTRSPDNSPPSSRLVSPCCRAYSAGSGNASVEVSIASTLWIEHLDVAKTE
jgi:hypothetical protein